MRNRSSGFTLIELLVLVAIAAILTTVAAPSFASFFSKKRVEGLVSQLVTDLQYARSEAAQRNTPVQVTLGTNCYVIHALPNTATTASASTSCAQGEGTASTIGTGETELKTVKVAASNSTSLTPVSGTILFDPMRGMATISGGAATIKAVSSVGSWDMRATITALGVVKTCSPAGLGNIVGYPAC